MTLKIFENVPIREKEGLIGLDDSGKIVVDIDVAPVCLKCSDEKIGKVETYLKYSKYYDKNGTRAFRICDRHTEESSNERI